MPLEYVWHGLPAPACPGLRPPRGLCGTRIHGLTYLAIWVLTLTLTLAPPALRAEDTSDRVTGAIDLISADSLSDRSATIATIDALTESDVTDLCRMLVAPGTGDDTHARMLLHAIALRATEPGAARTEALVRAVSAHLRTDADDEVKRFLVRTLQLAGAGVPALADLLADEQLGGPAAAALQAIGGNEARDALRQALAANTCGDVEAVIAALGTLRDREATMHLLERVTDGDDRIRAAALAALAEIGDRRALNALVEATTAISWQKRSVATADLLTWVSRADASGTTGTATATMRAFVETNRIAKSAHVRSALLDALAGMLGPNAVSDVVSALTDPDLEIRSAAVYIAVALEGEGVTGEYVDELNRAKPPARATILSVLARRGDESALPAALWSLDDPDAAVRIAAVDAAATLGRAGAVDPLVRFIGDHSGQEASAAASALVGIAGADASRAIAGHVARADGATASVLLGVLADRRAAGELATILEATRRTDTDVRFAAIEAIQILGDAEAVPRLLEMLAESTSARERERTQIESALAATCVRGSGGAPPSAPILAALRPEHQDEFCSLLRVLSHIGGTEAFEAVRRAVDDPREDVRSAAVRAVGDWPDAGPADAILEMAIKLQDLRGHVLLLRGYVRLAGIAEPRATDERLGTFDAAMRAARRNEERTLILSAIGKVADASALDMLRPYLNQEALAGEAASAMLEVADALMPAGWETARDVAREVTSSSSQIVVERAAELLERASAHEDFIVDWLVSGPYAREGLKGEDLIDVAFGPEQPDATDTAWRAQPRTEDAERHWFIDITVSAPGANSAAYLRTNVFSPSEQDVRLEIGSDDGVKVWLNGVAIHTNSVLRGCGRGDDAVDCTLNEGWNELLVKVTNNHGGFGACARFRTLDGGHLDGVYAKASGAPTADDQQ